MEHVTVLLRETVDGLDIKNGYVVVDGTLGGGGHTHEIVKRYSDKVKIIALDLDTDAIVRTKKRLDGMKYDIVFREVGFQDLDKVLDELDIKEIDGILLDLGLSNFQLETAGRGFSFTKDEPLLMTMKKNPSDDDTTAYDIVNTWEEKSIADIIYGFGEEKFSRKIAKAIVEVRKEKEIKTTFDLVDIIEKAVGKNYKGLRIHPSTRTFQALRIACNLELSNLESILEKGFVRLRVGGRMSIISFHSLEDRIVKRAYIKHKEEGKANIITKKPIIPSEYEIKSNPKSRSAKLRVIEKI